LALKKQQFKDDEIPIFDEACVYKRGEYWQFRMWLAKENKYARKSLRTCSETTAVERGKAAYLEIYANLQQGRHSVNARLDVIFLCIIYCPSSRT
jgi:hypothetical protein